LSRTLVVVPGPFDWWLGMTDENGLARLRIVDVVAGMEGVMFRARVTALAPELGGLFADIGRDDQLFVRLPHALRRRPPQEGEALLVQGVADAVADKGPRGTTRRRLVGAALALRDDDMGPAVAAHIGTAEADTLRRRAEELFPNASVDLSSDALALDDRALAAEWRALKAVEATVRERFAMRDAPGPLLTEDERLALALRASTADVTQVLTTPPARLRVARLLAPLGLDAAMETGEDPWVAAGAGDAVATLAAPEVEFADGAALVVEPTRAFVAVDVDRRQARDGVSDLNDAAVAALARTIALRELAGQIVVDFLDPGGADGHQRLERRLATALAALDVRVVAVLRSGLAVLERPRRAAALHERCDAVRVACDALLRQAARHAMVEARVAPDLDDRLTRPSWAEAARAWLASQGAELRRHREPNLPPTTFTIERRVG